MPTTPDVLTIDQLARYLQITRSTLYKLVQAGRVPGKKVGRQWRFHRDAIDKWLADSPLGKDAARPRAEATAAKLR
jgi:excisionase family DNA binding protein